MKRNQSPINLRRYFLPGLKKWIFIGTIGFTFGVLGILLLLELRPISRLKDFIWDTTQQLASFMPTYVSGSIAIVIAIGLITIALIKGNKTVVRAIAPEHGEDSVLDALDKVHSLSHGIKVVTIGGGTGLSNLLSGLKHYTTNLTAIVTVADDGGSSGKLREELGIIPPGDIRNCIAALSDQDKIITELFQYRFEQSKTLEGHSFGNLFLTALKEVVGGDFVKAVKAASLILKSSGTVLPSSPEPMKISAELEDGTIIDGESNIPEAKSKIKRIIPHPKDAPALEEAVEAITGADLIVLGPGSLYTSIIPNLLVPGIQKALKESNAHIVYVCNIMTQPGETTGYSVSDHIRPILEHANNQSLIEGVIVNDMLPQKLLEKYKKKDQDPVEIDAEAIQDLGVRIVARSLIKEDSLVRHNADLLARAIMVWFKRWQKYPVKKKQLVEN